MPVLRSRVWLLPLCAAACVSYQPQDVELRTVPHAARALAVPTPLTFAEAGEFALRHNPQLRALAADARAAGADLVATEVQGQWSSDQGRMALMVDPLALLRLAQRGAAVSQTQAREGEALQALAVARWRVLGRIAEVFAALHALQQASVPDVSADVAAFAAAGLASPNAVAQAEAAQAAAAAERLAIRDERLLLLAELRPLLGVPDSTPLEPMVADSPAVPRATSDEAALLRRPDLALALARWRVADADFRRACADQYPSLQIGPDLPLGTRGIEGMAWFKIPLDASGPARAAQQRRDAAHAQLLDAVLTADSEARALQLGRDVAVRRQQTLATAAAASQRAAASARSALAVEVDAFERFAERAAMAVRDAIEHRQSAAAAARAEVRVAVANGWPATEVQS